MEVGLDAAGNPFKPTGKNLATGRAPGAGGTAAAIAGKADNFSISSPGFMNWRAEEELIKQESEWIKAQLALTKDWETRMVEMVSNVTSEIESAKDVFNIGTKGSTLSVGDRYKPTGPSLMGAGPRDNASGAVEASQSEKDKLMEIEKNFNTQMRETQMQAAEASLGMMKEAFAGNKAAMIGFMVAEKAMAVARIMINTEVGASGAIAGTAMLGPAGYALGMSQAAMIRTMGYISAGMVGATAVMEGINIAGGREFGGPVSAGQSYIVGEKRPELFTPGASGTITPYVPKGGITVNIENSGTSKAFDVQQIDENTVRIIARDEAKQSVYQHAPKAISGEIRNPNSQVSKALDRSTQTQRRR